jgi:sulfoxide reductase heme-binding subunit YedZ
MKTPFQKYFNLFLKLAVHLGGLLPLAFLAWDAVRNNLTINPIQAVEQRTGDAAIALLMASLACTPVATLFGPALGRVVRHRRALGLYAFGYAALHLGTFLWLDYGLNWGLIWDTVSEKPYIIAGSAAFLGLVPLAVTSFRWWMKRLGKGWTKLHRLVYPVGGLVVLHFAWVVKGNLATLNGDVLRPVLYALAFTLLMVLRIPAVKQYFQRRRRGKPVRINRPASKSELESHKVAEEF